MDMKKLFHVLVVGGAVIGTSGGCSKSKPASGSTETPAAQTTPGTSATSPKPDSDTNGTPQKPEAQPPEKGGGAAGW